MHLLAALAREAEHFSEVETDTWTVAMGRGIMRAQFASLRALWFASFRKRVTIRFPHSTLILHVHVPAASVFVSENALARPTNPVSPCIRGL